MAIDTAKSYRSFFDKAGGEYTALAGPDKEAYLKLNGGDETKAKKMWDQMKYGPGGAPGQPGGGGTTSPAAVPPSTPPASGN